MAELEFTTFRPRWARGTKEEREMYEQMPMVGPPAGTQDDTDDTSALALELEEKIRAKITHELEHWTGTEAGRIPYDPSVGVSFVKALLGMRRGMRSDTDRPALDWQDGILRLVRTHNLVHDEHDWEDGSLSVALFSQDRAYRYLLARIWDWTRPLSVWCLLNPSVAGANRTDPTFTRGLGYARAWQAGGVVYVNPMAICATKPAQMRRAADPVGPANPDVLRWAAGLTGQVVCGWGSNGDVKALQAPILRAQHILQEGADLMAIGLTATGRPVHPLMQRADLKPFVWQARIEKGKF